MAKVPPEDREVLCKKCRYFMTYIYDERVYVCETCGAEIKAHELRYKKVQPKRERTLTKRERILEEFGDILDEMANYEPNE